MQNATELLQISSQKKYCAGELSDSKLSIPFFAEVNFKRYIQS